MRVTRRVGYLWQTSFTEMHELPQGLPFLQFFGAEALAVLVAEAAAGFAAGAAAVDFAAGVAAGAAAAAGHLVYLPEASLQDLASAAPARLMTKAAVASSVNVRRIGISLSMPQALTVEPIRQ